MLMQFDPFREFDRLAEQLAAGGRTPRPFPMDAYRRGDEFVASFDLPGLAPGTIDLTVEQNVLTIKHAGADAIMPSAGGPLFDRSSVIGD